MKIMENVEGRHVGGMDAFQEAVSGCKRNARTVKCSVKGRRRGSEW